MSDGSSTPDMTINAELLASEVMASATRILALLDLSDREIADLFEAEAGEGTACDHSLPANFDDHDDITDARPWKLHTLENESFSKEIDRFARRF